MPNDNKDVEQVMADTFVERREWILANGMKSPTIIDIIEKYHVLSSKDQVISSCERANLFAIFFKKSFIDHVHNFALDVYVK